MGASPSRPAGQQHQPSSATAPTQAEKLANYSTGNGSSSRRNATVASAPARHDTTHGHVSLQALRSWDSAALDAPTARLAAMTLHNAPLKTSVRRRQAETADQHVFSHVIPEQGSPITNQKNSGRCWLFATTNVVRIQVIKTLNLKDFQLSQSYLAFYDKLEKSNTFLENAIELADKPVDDRIFGFLKTAPTNDGGQWDMVTNLIKKYGLVPQSVFPESYNSSNSNQINWLLTLKLREYALELRELKLSSERALREAGQHDNESNKTHVMHTLRARKDAQMAEVYRIMVIALGVPPKADEEFTFEFYDKNDKFHRLTSTPLKFLEDYTGSFDPAGACSLINDPRRDYDKLVTVDRLQNVWGGQPVLYVNTTTEQMKQSVIQTIKAGLPVFFGCDVGQFSNEGIMDTDVFDYELPFGIKLGLSKAERIDMGESSMTHAMVITGVHLGEDGRPVRYRVENSWGDAVGDKGFMVMTDKWFDEFVYQVVIRKQHMPAKLWKLFEDGVNEETDVLPPYDPMGSLANSSVGPSSSDASQTSEFDIDDPYEPNRDYEIQLILDHQNDFEGDGKRWYLVAWKGFSAKYHTWEPEAGLRKGGKDALEHYWKHNARVVLPHQRQGKRRRTRWLTARDRMCDRMTVDDVRQIASKEERIRVLKQIGTNRRDMYGWETFVKEIRGARLDETGRKIVTVVFVDGFRFDYPLHVVRTQCPSKLLDFYAQSYPFALPVAGPAQEHSDDR